MKETLSLGIDVGSVSTNFAVLDEKDDVIAKIYIRTHGRPIDAIKEGMAKLHNALSGDTEIGAVGTTGSGRQLAGVIVGADVVKNEITTHAAAACHLVPEAATVLEIGGQDSKIILLRGGVVSDFAMNTVCAAGTGSFLDRQAERLKISIEDFGSYALKAKCPVRIAGRCAVFAESDMISKQQMGHTNEDIIAGLCEALVRNYLSNVAKGKQIRPPVVFQGGVAANVGIASAFEKALGQKIHIPQHFDVMGAFGAALIAKQRQRASQSPTRFCGFDAYECEFTVDSRECQDCDNRCEVIGVLQDGQPIAYWGDRCGKWSQRGASYRDQEPENDIKQKTHVKRRRKKK